MLNILVFSIIIPGKQTHLLKSPLNLILFDFKYFYGRLGAVNEAFMNGVYMIETIVHKMREEGYEIRVLAIERLQDIEKDIADLHSLNYLDERIDRILENSYKFTLPACPFEIKSVIVAASPCPQTRVVFNCGGSKVPMLIPPTYMEYSVEPIRIEKCLNEILAEGNLHAERVKSLPEKLLAARSGLGSYGRNNIIYVRGMGSFVLLSVYYSDVECDKENWNEITTMKACANCSLCRNICPTGAIAEDRYLVRAERCITYYNEFETAPDFPEWMNPEGHNCIIGCLHCQQCCPQNKRFLDNIMESVEFDDKETDSLLNGFPMECLPGETIAKLETIKMDHYYSLLARNMKALIYKARRNGE